MGESMWGKNMWASAVLGPDGRIYSPPCGARRALRLDCSRFEKGEGAAEPPVEFIGPEFSNEPWKYGEAVLGPDGCVYAPPCTAGRALRIDCATGKVQLFGPDFGDTQHKWDCAVLGPDGCIYAPPSNAGQVLKIDCKTLDVRLIGPELGGVVKYCCAVVGPDGCIYCPPNNAGRVLKIHCSVRATARFVEEIGPELFSGGGGGCYVAAALAGDGRIYAPPFNSHQVLRIDCTGPSVDLIGEPFPNLWQKWSTIALGGDGCLYAPPCNAKQVLRIDCAQGAVDCIGEEFAEFPDGPQKWRSHIVGPDGSVYCIPCHDTHVLRIRLATGAPEVEIIGEALNEDLFKFRFAILGPAGDAFYAMPYNAGQLLRFPLPDGAGAVFYGDEPPRPPEPPPLESDSDDYPLDD